MINNPTRAYQGGDVEGEMSTDNEWGVGESLEVAKASYDPGYDLTTTLSDAGIKVSKADLVKGYCDYGDVIGEK